MRVFWFFITTLFFSSQGFGLPVTSPQGITIQGSISSSASQPVESSNVAFTLEVLSPNPKQCVLYRETHTLNMTNSGGAFSLTLGAGTRSVSANYEDNSTLAQVFSNIEPDHTSLTCTTGNSYQPSSGDARQLRITFNDGASGNQTLTQLMPIQTVPYALWADTLEGKKADDFVKINTTSGKALSQANLESVFDSAASVTELLALIDGSSTSFSSSASPTFSGSVTASGGIVGSSASGGDLTLDSTSHATKGDIILAPTGGNVGIGTASPSYPLSVVSNSASSPSFGIQNANAVGWSGLDFMNELGVKRAFIGWNNSGNALSDRMYLGTNGSFPIIFMPNNSESMRISSGGNVGIGTTSPSSRLEVTGDIKLSSAANRTISVGDVTSGTGNNLTVTGGGSTASYGGSITLKGGNGNVGPSASLVLGGSGFNGGNVSLVAGSSDTNGTAGSVLIQAGTNGANGVGGTTTISGGTGGMNNYPGGPIYLFGGAPGGSSTTYGNTILAHNGTVARGYVGIGTAAPSAQLEVNTPAIATQGLKVWGLDGQTAHLQSWGIPSNGTMAYVGANGAIYSFNSVTGAGLLSTDAGGYTGINVNGQNRQITFSPSGSSTADTRIYRSGANLLTLDNGSGSSANLSVIGGISTTQGISVGNTGTYIPAMGGCRIENTAISDTATSYTCNGVPASSDLSIHCSGTQAMTNANTNSVYCRASGAANQVICNTTLANAVSMNWICSFIYLPPPGP